MTDLLETQKQLELEMHLTGIEGYRKKVQSSIANGIESNTPYGLMMLKRSVDAVAASCDSFVIGALSGAVTKSPSSATLMNSLDSEVCAYVTLKACVDGVSGTTSLTKLAMKIGGSLEDQFKLDFFKQQDQFIFNKIYKKVTAQTTNRYYRRYNLLRELTRLELTVAEAWNKHEKMTLGCKLIDLVIQTTGLIKIETQTVGRNKTVLMIRGTEGTLEWINKVNGRGEALCNSYGPCVIKPKDWTTPIDGGFYTAELFNVPLIKTSNLNYFEDMQYYPMPEEYSAINTLQGSKFQINQPILEFMQECWSTGLSWGGLVSREDSPLPPFPFSPDKDTKNLNEADAIKFKDWKKAATRVYQFNARSMSKRLATTRTLQIAEKYKEFDEMYFVYQNDFRFRKYVTSAFLSPQGADPSKALLHFSNGRKLGKRGAFWLAVQGANTYGEDKITLQQRYDWVKENSPWIIKCAEDPMVYKEWCDADKPWQFLAFCFEWQGQSILGENFESKLPIALDGCNNGIQHLSALARDYRGGEATNLMPSAMPNDIYQEVADACVEELEKRDDPVATKWLKFGVTRKCCKRPVMVVPYGGRLFSCRGYIEEYIHDQLADGKPDVFEGKYFEASNYLSRILWESISEVVVSARKVMDWVQGIASLASKAGFPMAWQTPTGAFVSQNYEALTSKRVTTHIDGVLVKPQFRETTEGKLDRRRSVNGSSPNFIHSLDASAMTKTINLCRQRGLTDFCMIHDSYAVHAGELSNGENCTDVLFASLREAFVDMYVNNNPLSDLRESILEIVDKVPEPPKMGTLDITKVTESEFFFS